MRKKWKKTLTAVCTAAMLLTMPGISVLADELQIEDVVREGETQVEDVVGEGEIQVEDVVGEGEIQVGEGVTATFDEETGAVEFYSDEGELWKDWLDKSGIDKKDIKSISVAEGKVYLPSDSRLIFAVYHDKSEIYGYSSNLKELDLSGFDTSRVTNMAGMFLGCSSLTTLDLSKFDTTNVTNMIGIFYGCSSLTTLDLSKFDTSNVEDMQGMFTDCSSLTTLKLSSFNTSKVSDMTNMFSGCEKLTNLDLSKFDTKNVTGMYGMFANCYGLTTLDLSKFDTTNVTNMSFMFFKSNNLTTLDVSSFDTSNVEDMSIMFADCSSLTTLDVSKFNTSNVTDMYAMFVDCSALTALDLSNFDTSNVVNMYGMFYGCSSLTTLDLSSFDTSNVEDTEDMFAECSSLEELKTPGNNATSLELPHVMYDEAGNEYDEVPVLSESIVLTKDNMALKEDISDYEIALSASNYVYDGKAKEPTVTVKNDSATLTEGTDYTVSYIENTDAGTANVKVKGVGNYKGELSTTFKIEKANAKLAFAKSAVSKKTTDAAFTNALTKTTDGTVTFKSSNTKVAAVNSTSGLVTIKGAGTATITATAAAGKNYKSGSATFTLTVKAPTSGFSDVQNPKHPYYEAIYWAADKGITKGYPDGTFGINRSCTRGEMMMFLWRYAGKKEPKTVSKSPFKDVPKNHTFYKAILWGSQRGITKGYSDGTFGVNRNVTRGECMMFLWRLKNKPEPKAVAKAPFPDVPKSHVFYKAVLWGYQNKITKGFTSGELKGKFGVDANCSRGQIVTFLYRAK